MRTKLIAGLAAGTLALGTAFALAQSHHHGHGSQQKPAASTDHSAQDAASHGSKAKGDAGPSSLAYQAINAKMHEGMDITFTGNADIDFVRGMIPHHKGAVAMAKVALQYSKDPEIRKLAEDIIKAQDIEIAQMEAFLKKKGTK